ncbi:unnamed protein product [Schistosoma turkestanicum]|nr:unnamed protein product [Schistosoma turkestanicum]
MLVYIFLITIILVHTYIAYHIYSPYFTLAHKEGIWCCTWGQNRSKNKQFIITGSLDNGLIAWEWTNNQLKCLHHFEGHRLGVISVDINSTGTLAASSSLDSQISTNYVQHEILSQLHVCEFLKVNNQVGVQSNI